MDPQGDRHRDLIELIIILLYITIYVTAYGSQVYKGSEWVGKHKSRAKSCQDQVARIARATVAKAMTGGSGHGQRACDRHLQALQGHRR